MRGTIAQAVLGREEVARVLRESENGRETRARIQSYLDELQTTQRYALYRALKHPLYPILRKIERIGEHVERAEAATRAGRVVYTSTHKSHLDYVVQPLVLDDHGVRQPVIAAAIGLFGGALGWLHRHVTGAVPIRRSSGDRLYLLTLKAYVAELLRTHDFLFYPEGGRSYSGELKRAKTGLLQATLQSEHPATVIVPTAVAYDLVLEDRLLARQLRTRASRPFSRELLQLMRDAAGYRTRAFVTFGTPIAVAGIDPHSTRAVLDLAQTVVRAMGGLYKVLPTAVVAAAVRPGVTCRELEDRADTMVEALRAAGANLGVSSGTDAVELGLAPLELRGALALADGRIHVKARAMLRYYARTIEHLLRPLPLLLIGLAF